FSGSVEGTFLQVNVLGDVAQSGDIQTGAVEPLLPGANGFSVGGNFAGRLNAAVIFVPNSTGAPAVLVGGDVTATAHLTIAAQVGVGATILNGSMLGRLTIEGELTADLIINGRANQIIITGPVGDSSLAAPVQIEIGGALIGTLTTGSLFKQTGPKRGVF